MAARPVVSCSGTTDSLLVDFVIGCSQLHTFLQDVSRHSCAGQSVIVAALLDTGMLWQYGGPGSRTSTPLLTAQQIQLGDWTSPVTGASLQQPVGGPALQLGPQLRDFWSGGVRPCAVLLPSYSSSILAAQAPSCVSGVVTTGST